MGAFDHPDGNSAALRQYEREHANDSQLWEEWAERIADGWTDEILIGRKAGGFDCHDLILDYITSDDLISIFRSQSRDKREEAFEDVEKKLRERIREFFLRHCSEEIWEAITDMEEA